MAKILITGAGGQLGREFVTVLAERAGMEVRALDRSTLDITKEETVREQFADFHPDICLNCAAYTAVDRAESEPESAQAINVTGAAHLAKACLAGGTRLVHFSSDYVYTDGAARPRRETDRTEPRGIYAQSKLAGEQRIQAILPDAVIIRTSWLYSTFGHNFVKTMLRLGRERDELRVVYDQVGGPTYARDLARYTLGLLLGPQATELAGINNFSNAGVASWYDFCLAIHELSGIDCTVHPIETAAYPTPAPRPAFSVLDTSKIRALGGPIRHWRVALGDMLSTLSQEE